ncbi:MAG: LemA family protein [Thermotogae bacterium]|nr:LemA family protein [Thermotogota bacterium]
MGFLILLLILLLLVSGGMIFLYNSLVKKRELVKEAWSGVEVQLKRRADLIPNLVEVVKGYAKHEREVFERIVEARARSLGAGSMKERMEAEGELTKALKSIIALSERYPDLKANQNFLELQKTLGRIEDELQLARRYYNATVRDYNTAISSFPANVIANRLGFSKEEYFDLDVEAFKSGEDAVEQRKAPKVDF